MKRPFVIAISGPTSAGKTYFTEKLVKKLQLDEISFEKISTDDFYRDLSHLTIDERSKINFDNPDSIDKVEFIDTLKLLTSGKNVKIKKYDFTIHNKIDEIKEFSPNNFIIVEGIFSLSFEEIRKFYDLKIYVELDPDIRIMRRLIRDVKERNRTIESVLNQYLNSIKPTETRYVINDKQFCDFIIDGNKKNEKIIDLILSYYYYVVESKFNENPN